MIEYSKVLLEGETVPLSEEEKKNQRYKGRLNLLLAENKNKKPNIERIDAFLVFINLLLEKYPDFQYTLFYKSKLLMSIDRFEEAKKSLIPFVKRKKNDFWVWDLLSEAYEDDIDIQIGCLSKALTLNTKESFLVKIHQKLADLLVKKELFKEASVEVLNAINIRKKNDWNINSELINYTNKDWYNENLQLNDNQKFYVEQALLAEELLYNNHTEHEIVVSFVNTNKRMVSFIKNKMMHGFFSYKHLKINPKIGDILDVRLNQVGDEGFYKVLTVKPSSQKESEALKVFSGIFKAIPNKDFGFVNDVFIAPQIVNRNNLEDGSEVKCKSILSFNKKKNEWGWKVLEIIKQ